MATNIEIFCETMKCLKYLVDKTAEMTEKNVHKRKPKFEKTKTYVVKTAKTHYNTTTEIVVNCNLISMEVDNPKIGETEQNEVIKMMVGNQQSFPIETKTEPILNAEKYQMRKKKKVSKSLLNLSIFKTSNKALFGHLHFNMKCYRKNALAVKSLLSFKNVPAVNKKLLSDFVDFKLEKNLKRCIQFVHKFQHLEFHKKVSIIFKIDIFYVLCLFFRVAMYLKRKQVVSRADSNIVGFTIELNHGLIKQNDCFPSKTYVQIELIDIDLNFIRNLALESELVKWIEIIHKQEETQDQMDIDDKDDFKFAVPDIAEYENVVKSCKLSLNSDDTFNCVPPSYQVKLVQNENEMKVDSLFDPATPHFNESESQDLNLKQTIFGDILQIKNQYQIQTQLLSQNERIESFNEVTARKFINFKPAFEEPKVVNVLLSNGFVATQCGTLIEIQKPTSRSKLERADTLMNKETFKSQAPISQSPVLIKAAKKRAFMKVGLLKSQKIRKHLHSNVKQLN
jgi:hypothetical protein